VKELKTNISTSQLSDEELKVGAYCSPAKEEDFRNIESNPDFTKIGFATPKKSLDNITMEELIAYKNGCELICKQFVNEGRPGPPLSFLNCWRRKKRRLPSSFPYFLGGLFCTKVNS
jgi:hypothetical protein